MATPHKQLTPKSVCVCVCDCKGQMRVCVCVCVCVCVRMHTLVVNTPALLQFEFVS